jgi:drug/metabolite transporter (DMT)-like permease
MNASTTALPSSASTVGRGILHMLAAVFVFSVSNALVKWSAATYPVGEITFFRNLAALVPTMAFVAAHGGLGRLRTRRPLAHLLRGGAGVVSMLLIFYSFKRLPIADATAISFAAPIFMTALSVPLLKEKVGVYRWSAVVVGFIGVLVITRPGRDVLNLGAAAAVVSSATYALAMIGVRHMSRTEHPVTIMFYFAVIGTAAMALLLPFGWVTPDVVGAVILTAVGLTGGIGQYFLTQAFRLAPAAVAAPFNYAGIVFAGAFGYFIWDEVPSAHVLIGSAVVIASGLFIIYRETMLRGAKAAAEQSSR